MNYLYDVASDGRRIVPFSKFREYKSYYGIKRDSTISPHLETLLKRITDTEKRKEFRKELKKYYGLLSQHRGLKVKFEEEDRRCRTHTCVELLSECNYVIEDSKENIDRIHKEILDYLRIDMEELQKILLECGSIKKFLGTET
tara:strand:+ start:72 stop:500 length:429 start_codon:yes stop_codon:yes gene_type:complete